jgi:CheY-like chemotaxis protein
LEPLTRILLADCDPALRTRLASALTLAGHAVEEAGSQEVILDLLRRSLVAEAPVYDIIVCSVSIPGWSGLNLLYAIGQFRPAPRIVLLQEPIADYLLTAAYRIGPAMLVDRQVDGPQLCHIVADLLA